VISRRAFLGTMAGGLLAAPLAAEGQAPPKIHRIGLLSVPPAYLAAFEESLRQLGYVRGRNILFEIPQVGTATEPRTGAAAELVRLNVEVIVTGPNTFIDVARQATTTVPIVMVYGSDPVGRGYIASLARPGGNVTGLTSEPSPEIVGKYIEFLSELSPRPSRFACLVDPATPERPLWKEADTAAKRRGVTLHFVEVRAESDVGKAFSAMGSTRVDAVIILGGPALWSYRRQIADLARKNRLATVYRYREGPEAGGLMSYGPSLIDSWRRAAIYVDKILKGAKPADLPVEQPTKFELVINLKTAKALGLTIPPSLLARADEVIQ
jgi:putative ABC transport system substrate-binding protein